MRRWQKITLVSVAALLALPLLAVAVVWLLLRTDPSFVERLVGRLTNNDVVLQGLSGALPGDLRLARLQLRDPVGVWLEADDVSARWSVWPLLEKRIAVDQLQAARLALSRAPTYPPSRNANSSQGLWFRSLAIGQVELTRLELGAPLAGQAVALRVQAAARYRPSQELMLRFDARRLDAVTATYHVNAELARNGWQGELTLAEGAGGPLANLLQLPALGDLAVQASLNGPPQAIATQLTARAGPLSAGARGTLDVLHRAVDADITLDAPAMAPRPDLSWQRIALRAHLQGTPAAPRSSGQLDITDLNAGMLKLGAMQAQLRSDDAALELDAQARSLVLPGRAAGLLAGSPLALHAEARLGEATRPIDVTLSHPLLQARAHYEADAKGNGSLQATFPDLKPLSDVAGLDLRGRGTLEAQLTGGGKTRRLQLKSALAINGGALPWATLLAPQAQLSADMQLTGEQLKLSSFELQAANLQASARGTLATSDSDLRWTVSLPKLQALSSALAGQLRAQGQVQGALPRLAMRAEVDGDLAAHGSPTGALHLSFQGRDLPQKPNGRLELSGMLDAAPVQLALAISSNARGLNARVERGSWKSAQAQGAVNLPSGGELPQGRLELRMAQLSDLDRLLGQPVQGSLDAVLAFEQSQGRARARVNVDASNVGVPSQQLQSLQLRGEVDDPTGNPTLSARMTAAASLSGVSAKLTAAARGPFSALALNVDVDTNDAQSQAGSLRVRANWLSPSRSLQFSALTARYRGETLRLTAPTTVSLADGMRVDRLQLTAAGAVLDLSGSFSPQLNLDATVTHLTTQALRPLWPTLEADGEAQASAHLQGTLAAPVGTLEFNLKGLQGRSGVLRGLPSTDADFKATLAGTTAQVDTEVRGGAGLKLDITGQAPLGMSAPMDLRMQGDVDLALANPVLEAGGQRLLGQVHVDGKLGGTPAAPQAQGTLQIARGDLQDYSRGAHLQNITATLVAHGPQLTLQRFTASAGGGSLTAQGTIDLAIPMPVNLSVTARNAQPLTSDLITANVDAELKMTGALRQQVTVAGTLHVNHADINVPNALPPDVAVLNVIRPGQAAPSSPSVDTSKLLLNITVEAPRAVFVRGRGLDAELGGTLRVGGAGAAPTFSGGFDMRNGTFNLAGASLTFSSGRLSFNGTGVRKKIDPTLDFVASNSSGGITSKLAITGYADAPVITLSSNPDAPQDDVLSRLLFGEAAAQLTPLQIAQIGAALATMSGVGGGLNPLNAVQRRLGLDRLAISGGSSGSSSSSSSESSNSASIEAGRYVSSRVYVGGKESTTGNTQAQVQIDLTKRLKLQTTLGTGGGPVQGATPENDPGSSIGLSYQFEY